MALCSAQVTSRSNSDLCNIENVSNDTSLSPEARMELIYAYAVDWDRATTGTTGRFAARKEAKRRRPWTEYLMKLAQR